VTEITNLGELDSTPHADVFDRRRPRTVRLSLDEGERVPPHAHPGFDVVLHLLTGRLKLELDGDAYDLEPGDLVQFSGEREVSPRAIERSTAVVVFAPADA
jgi:quercetin dioxygenase-like cupin family protein